MARGVCGLDMILGLNLARGQNICENLGAHIQGISNARENPKSLSRF